MVRLVQFSAVVAMLVLSSCVSSDTSDSSTSSSSSASPTASMTVESSATGTSSPASTTTTPESPATTSSAPARVFELFYVPANGMYLVTQSDFRWMTGTVSPEAEVVMNERPAEVENSGAVARWFVRDTYDPDGATDVPPSLTLDLDPGSNTLEFTATFADGEVLKRQREIFYDPELQRETGSIIEWSTDDRTITFAIAPYGSVNDEPWGQFGPITKVETYPVRDDAAFVLLEQNSSGEPPEMVADFDAFVSEIEAAINGEGRIFASRGFALGTPDESGYPFAILVTPEGAVQQVEQIWGP